MATKDFEKDISQQTGTFDDVIILVVIVLRIPPGYYAAVQKKTFTKWVNSHLGKVKCDSVPVRINVKL